MADYVGSTLDFEAWTLTATYSRRRHFYFTSMFYTEAFYDHHKTGTDTLNTFAFLIRHESLNFSCNKTDSGIPLGERL